jgi:PLP dependent protein
MSAETAAPIHTALAAVQQRIVASEQKYARAPGSVQLLAVSKTQSAQRVREAFACGQRRFAENYLQEALAKREQLGDVAIEWHFIGPIQSNKTRDLAEHFDWIHTVDRLKIAERLSVQRPAAKGALNVLIQVNISEEDSKSGVDLATLPALAADIARLPNLVLCGLMAIPAPGEDFKAQRRVFHRLAEARDALVKAGHSQCTALSMGMSADYEAAIAEGATHVRIGTDIFGARH